jgi:glycosyltransferase involved in cell wall biosynthesis
MNGENERPNAECPMPNAQKKRLRILISAYACEPGKGSEPGCGWNYVNEVSKYCDVTVVTRGNNESVISDAEREHGRSRINWIYYDLPSWVMRIKKRFNLVNTYYFLWQWFSVKSLESQLKDKRFDIHHHLTFGSYSKPTFLYRLKGAPFIWGPVGGIVSPRLSFLRQTTFKAKIEEVVRIILQMTSVLNPFLYQIRNKAALVLGVSPRVLRLFPRNMTGHLSQVGIKKDEVSMPDNRRDADSEYTIFMAGRLLHWKGFALGIEGFAEFLKTANAGARLIIVGEGPEESKLRQLVDALGISDRVSFLGNLERTKYFSALRSAHVFLFPSTHEPGSYVVAESLALGIPVICTDFGEPATLVEDGMSGFAVPLNSYSEVVTSIASGLNDLENREMWERFSSAARTRATVFEWEERGKMLFDYYSKVACGANENHSGS